jgi:cold shock CspA family protein
MRITHIITAAVLLVLSTGCGSEDSEDSETAARQAQAPAAISQFAGTTVRGFSGPDRHGEFVGTVKAFANRRGLIRLDRGQDLFVYAGEIVDAGFDKSLDVGDRVWVDIQPMDKGNAMATNVSLVRDGEE